MISTEGNARALHFSPAPTGPDFFTPLWPGFDRANFHVIIQTRAGPQACFRLLYILDIHQLVMKKIAALVETTRDRAAATVKSSSRELSAQLKSSTFKYRQ